MKTKPVATPQDLENLRKHLNSLQEYLKDHVMEVTEELNEAQILLSSLGVPRQENELDTSESKGQFKTEEKSIDLHYGTVTAIRYARADLSNWIFPSDDLLPETIKPYVHNDARWFIEYCMGWPDDPRGDDQPSIDLEWIRSETRKERGRPMPEDPLTFDVTFFDGSHYILALRYRLWNQWEEQLEDALDDDMHKDDAAQCLADFEALQRRLREIADLLEPRLTKIRNRLSEDLSGSANTRTP